MDRTEIDTNKENMELQKKARAEFVEKLRDLHCDIQTNAKQTESKINSLNGPIIGIYSEKSLLSRKIEDLKAAMTYDRQSANLIKM